VQVSGPKWTSGIRVHFAMPKAEPQSDSAASMFSTTQATWMIGPFATVLIDTKLIG
jgi:hypothetical protein